MVQYKISQNDEILISTLVGFKTASNQTKPPGSFLTKKGRNLRYPISNNTCFSENKIKCFKISTNAYEYPIILLV